MTESLGSIRKKLIGCSVFFIFTSVVSTMALIFPEFSPVRDSFGEWFQRSGSVMVVAAIWVEFILLKISPYIDPHGAAYVIPFDVSKVYKKWFSCLSNLAVIFALLGTIIWGYGDLFFPAGPESSSLANRLSNIQYAEISKALLTPVIAVLGAYIAWRQWKTAQNRLKLDLFERRVGIYDATKAFIASIVQSGKATDESTYQFLRATKEAKWLFNNQVALYLGETMWEKAVDLQTLESQLEGIPAGPERSENLRQQRDIKQWFNSQFKVIDNFFTDFLRISH